MTASEGIIAISNVTTEDLLLSMDRGPIVPRKIEQNFHGGFLEPMLYKDPTYYVDFTNGLDSNVGTDSAHPFKHSPGDSNATGNAASATPGPNDAVIFKGGVQYTGIMSLSWSGAAGYPITFDGNSAGTFGTGKAIIDGGGSANAAFSIPDPGGLSYLTFNYLEIRNSTDGIYDKYGSDHITVSNCVIHDTGADSVDEENPNGAGGETGSGIATSGGSYWQIFGNKFYNTFNCGIAMSPLSYSNIYNNEFTDVTAWGIRICTTSGVQWGTATDLNIYNNSFHDIYFYDWSTDYAIHTDFIFVNPNQNGLDAVNIFIYNNLFYNDYTFTDNWGTAMINGEAGNGAVIENLYIYNNVFFNPHSYLALTLGGVGTRIYGNSIWTTSGAIDLYGPGDVTIKNNAITALGAPYKVNYTSLTIVADYNCYNPVYGNFVSNGVGTFAEWQAQGYDAHSKNLDPKFVNVTIGSEDLSLQASSPCKDAGATLGSPYDTDILGNVRVAGTYDIGAYEYGGAEPPASKMVLVRK